MNKNIKTKLLKVFFEEWGDELNDRTKNLIEKICDKKNKIDIVFLNKNNNQYNYKIKINNYNFNYFEGLGYDLLTNKNKNEKIASGLFCIIDEYFTFQDYENETDNFIIDFGYNDTAENLKKGFKVFKEMQKNKNNIDLILLNI